MLLPKVPYSGAGAVRYRRTGRDAAPIPPRNFTAVVNVRCGAICKQGADSERAQKAAAMLLTKVPYSGAGAVRYRRTGRDAAPIPPRNFTAVVNVRCGTICT